MPVIPHNQPTLGEEEQKAATKVLASNCLVAGEQTQLFENEICHYLGLPNGHAVATSSGSSALFVALTLLGSKDVLMPSYVCHSLKQATSLANAISSIVDTEQNSTIISQEQLLQSHADTLIYPYLYGHASPLPKFDGHIIEDIAQALGAKYKGNMLGTMGDCGVLSFYATKLITCGGQGGMLVSKNKSFIDAARNFLNFDMPTDKKAHFNLPLTEMQAAIGRVQLAKLEQFIAHRESIWHIYQSAGLPVLDETVPIENQTSSVRYRAVIKTDKAKALIAYLANHQIKAIIPIESWELLSPTPNATFLANNTVSLPIYPSLTLVKAKKIAELCQKFLYSKDNL